MKRGCKCGKSFYAKISDVKRGWGNSCSKSCAAQRRESKKRLGYKKEKISEVERLAEEKNYVETVEDWKKELS